MSKIPRKRVEKIFSKVVTHVEFPINKERQFPSVAPICVLAKLTPLEYDWGKYWGGIDTNKFASIYQYIPSDEFKSHSDYCVCLDMLRLLTLNIFIQDTYK